MVGLTVLLAVSAAIVEQQVEEECMPMKEVTALTFEEGGLTNRRRSPVSPKLHCVSNCYAGARVEAAQCVAQGSSDSGGTQWKCQGRVFGGFALGRVKVQCEGCEGPGDSNIRKGSCALQYTLVRTSGRGRDGFVKGRSYRMHQIEGAQPHADGGGSGTGALILMALFVGVCILASRSSRAATHSRYQQQCAPASPYGYPAAVHGVGGGSSGPGWGGVLGGLGTGMFLGSMMERSSAPRYRDSAGYGDRGDFGYAGCGGGGGYDMELGGGGGGGCGGGGGGGDAFGGTDVL
eukprot:TRINITY_DN8098_c0_g2_i2.p1 TRINITY_DN8098_c0_g2~~TRINITY_DN8098_c0_g2_i2.p1  ORF type:complete len:311 (+),score=104.94 TRINITY_DN8098_c0_g2_i2:63-935(+)